MIFFFANSDKPSEVEGFPQREWFIEVYLVNDKGELVEASLFDKVIYHLHPSFGPRATQSKSAYANNSTAPQLRQHDILWKERLRLISMLEI